MHFQHAAHNTRGMRDYAFFIAGPCCPTVTMDTGHSQLLWGSTGQSGVTTEQKVGAAAGSFASREPGIPRLTKYMLQTFAGQQLQRLQADD